MPPKALNYCLGFAVLATLAAVALYRFIPDKTLQVIPTDQWRVDLSTAWGEHQIDIAAWANEEQTQFTCIQNQKDERAPFCTLNIYFSDTHIEGLDISSYDTINIESSYTGNVERARFFMRNYKPDYSYPEDANSAKFMSMTIPSYEFSAPEVVEIGLNELMVAEWWLSQRDLERDQVPPEFGNVTIIGLDFTPYLEGAVAMEFEVQRLYFSGPRIKEQHWYLGILVVWILGVVVFLATQVLVTASRNRKYSQQVTALAEQSERYEELSKVDPLTGALNRLGLQSYLQTTVEQSQERVFALILMDIDHFKRINDRRGHDVGDRILKTLSALIKDSIRGGDVLCRWGGEEFIIIAQTNRIGGAFSAAEKLRATIAAHTFEPQKPLNVTCSFGVTLLNRPGEPIETALKRADIALYEAKEQGRNCTIVSEQDQQESR